MVIAFRIGSLQNAIIAVGHSLYGALPHTMVFNRKAKEIEYTPLESAEDEMKLCEKALAETPSKVRNWRLLFGVFVFGE